MFNDNNVFSYPLCYLNAYDRSMINVHLMQYRFYNLQIVPFLNQSSPFSNGQKIMGITKLISHRMGHTKNQMQ